MQEYEYTGKAMGTDYAISIVCTKKETADLLSAEAIDLIHTYEKMFSRFLPTSELSQLNIKKSIKVSPQFLEVIQKAYELYERTSGIFNPLIQVHRLGYDTTFETLTTDSEASVMHEPYNIDFSSVVIDKKHSIITLQPGQQLDVGGFLKGYLAEKLCKSIKESSSTIKGVIVNIGGDLHTQGVAHDESHFVFDIYNPVTKTEDISIPLHNQSLATSGTYKRTWKRSDKILHHIVAANGTDNPRTSIVSASVIHADGSIAEAYTKVCLSCGVTSTQFLGETFQYIIINKDGTVIRQS